MDLPSESQLPVPEAASGAPPEAVPEAVPAAPPIASEPLASSAASLEPPPMPPAVPKSHHVLRSCAFGCLALVLLFALGIFFLFHLLGSSSMEYRKTLPDNFPKEMVLFRQADAQTIAYTEGRKRSRALYVMTTPLRLFGDVIEEPAASDGSSLGVGKIFEAYGSQVGKVDTVTVVWRGLPANREEVLNYYRNLAQREGYAFQTHRDARLGTDIQLGSRDDVTWEMELDDASKLDSTIDAVRVTVRYLTP